MKRVVTGHNQDGKSVFVSIGEPPRVVTSEHGNQITYFWGTQRTPAVPARGNDPTPTMSSHLPVPAGQASSSYSSLGTLKVECTRRIRLTTLWSWRARFGWCSKTGMKCIWH